MQNLTFGDYQDFLNSVGVEVRDFFFFNYRRSKQFPNGSLNPRNLSDYPQIDMSNIKVYFRGLNGLNLKCLLINTSTKSCELCTVFRYSNTLVLPELQKEVDYTNEFNSWYQNKEVGFGK